MLWMKFLSAVDSWEKRQRTRLEKIESFFSLRCSLISKDARWSASYCVAGERVAAMKSNERATVQFHDLNLVTYTHDHGAFLFVSTFDGLHHRYMSNFSAPFHFSRLPELSTCNFELEADKIVSAFTSICNNNFLIECWTREELAFLSRVELCAKA